MSDGEQAIFDSLAAAGHSLTRELAVGRYNLDIAVDATVAVECFGGLWHSRGRHLARHEGRVRHILDAGFDIVVVWLTKGEPPLARLHEVISDLQFFRGDPSAKRQYRVIWRDADVLSRDADSDDFPCKPSFEVFRNARGRYERSR